MYIKKKNDDGDDDEYTPYLHLLLQHFVGIDHMDELPSPTKKKQVVRREERRWGGM